MKRAFSALSVQFRIHAAVFAAVLLLDQLTKHWARARFSGPDGEPDYGAFIPVLGDWLHFRLVYNHGAAFGIKPQNLLPFLHPVIFFAFLTLVAVVLFAVYYRRLNSRDKSPRLGITLILAGAIGNNLIDRPFLHKVTDFIDAGIPGLHPRWPVFNIADCAVSIGIALLLLGPLFTRGKPPELPHAV